MFYRVLKTRTFGFLGSDRYTLATHWNPVLAKSWRELLQCRFAGQFTVVPCSGTTHLPARAVILVGDDYPFEDDLSGVASKKGQSLISSNAISNFKIQVQTIQLLQHVNCGLLINWIGTILVLDCSKETRYISAERMRQGWIQQHILYAINDQRLSWGSIISSIYIY